jgi:cell division protein FtsB
MIWLLNFLPTWIFQAVALGLIVLGIGVYAFVKHPLVPSFIPKLIGVILTAGGIFISGGIWTQREFLEAVEKQKQEIARLEKASGEITTKVEKVYIERTKVIKEKGDVIIEKVPEYISKDADAKCDVPNGFVVLHNSAVKNEIPNTARDFNEKSSGVELSTVGKTVAGNYTTCNEVREQLRSLQDWVKEQEKLYNKP